MYLSIRKDVASVSFGNVTTVISVSLGTRHLFSGTGSLIWTLLYQNPTRHELLFQLRQLLEDVSETQLAECKSFLESLFSYQLIEEIQLEPCLQKLTEAPSEKEIPALLASQIRSIIEAQGTATIEISSSSMAPYFTTGDIVEISSRDINQLIPGDIIALLTDDGYLIHRLLRREGHAFYTRGDKNKYPDTPIPENRYIGIVSKIFSSTNKVKWLYTFVNLFIRPKINLIHSRMRWALISFVIATTNSPLSLLWRLYYQAAQRIAARYINHNNSSVYVTRSVARGDYVPGASDIDIVYVIKKNSPLTELAYSIQKQTATWSASFPVLSPPLIISHQLFELFQAVLSPHSFNPAEWRILSGLDIRTQHSQLTPKIVQEIRTVQRVMLAYQRELSFKNFLAHQTTKNPAGALRNRYARYEINKHSREITNLTGVTSAELETYLRNTFSFLNSIDGETYVEKAHQLLSPHAYREIFPRLISEKSALQLLTAEGIAFFISSLLYTIHDNPSRALGNLTELVRSYYWHSTGSYIEELSQLKEHLPEPFKALITQCQNTTVLIPGQTIDAHLIDMLFDDCVKVLSKMDHT